MTAALEGLDLVPTDQKENVQAKMMRHKAQSATTDEVRPIFWANRQSSYTARTALWDEYPNGESIL